jgi:predicted MFS family arabinose efflux permease
MTSSAPTLDDPPAAAVGQAAAWIFAAFAFAYFFSALIRAVMATLAPVFSSELGLDAADLGLLAGAYFVGFAALQLPLGRALDSHGPRRVLIGLLAVAAVGCAAFALARSLGALVLARMLIGAGLAACLMAPLTCYRRLFSPSAQLRANSWMLMTGSLGMLASTLPVQWLLPVTGWRGLFWGLAGLLLLAAWLVHRMVPPDRRSGAARPADGGSVVPPAASGYREIVAHPLFQCLAPLAFVLYGGLVAVQALWAGPWLTRVAGRDADAAAAGLFAINLAMLFAFMAWGAVMPRLARRGLGALRLMRWGLPVCMGWLPVIVLLGSAATAWHWALWCVACTFVSLSQPAVAQAFPAALAGRALSAFNLVIFAGVFCLQWGIGLLIDAAQGWGLGQTQAFQLSFGLYAAACAGAYAWFLWRGRGTTDNAG